MSDNLFAKWRWESPVPSLKALISQSDTTFQHALYPLAYARHGLVTILIIVAPTFCLFTGNFTFLPALFAMIVAVIAFTNDYIGKRRWPTTTQLAVLRQISEAFPEVSHQGQTLYDQKAMSFAIAKQLCISYAAAAENILFLRENSDPTHPPVKMTGTVSNNNHLVIDSPTGPLHFVPCNDGWYRLQVEDHHLHALLSVGAAGSDAGIYWINGDQEGIWGIPAGFASQVQSRVDAMFKAASQT